MQRTELLHGELELTAPWNDHDHAHKLNYALLIKQF